MEEKKITGTLIWYYYICQREVWLMARNLVPDQDNGNISVGRFIHDNSYKRRKKEVAFGNIKVDVLRQEGDELVIGEVKKTSRFKKSATMQLAFYLLELQEQGIRARGELLFPREKKKEIVRLNDQLIMELEKAKNEIMRVMYQNTPPVVKETPYCKKCAYAEYCWS